MKTYCSIFFVMISWIWGPSGKYDIKYDGKVIAIKA